MVKEAIELILTSQEYNQSKVTYLTNSLAESCLASLTKMQKPFKYIGKNFLLKFNTKGMLALIFHLFFSDCSNYAEKWCWHDVG